MQQSNVSLQQSARRRTAISRHATKRCQQRGFGQDVVPVITMFGDASYDGRGGVRYLMTDKAMTSLIGALGRNQRIDALAGAYVVVSTDGEAVITIGHRYA